jgi:hypothetical protein
MFFGVFIFILCRIGRGMEETPTTLIPPLLALGLNRILLIYLRVIPSPFFPSLPPFLFLLFSPFSLSFLRVKIRKCHLNKKHALIAYRFSWTPSLYQGAYFHSTGAINTQKVYIYI